MRERTFRPRRRDLLRTGVATLSLPLFGGSVIADGSTETDAPATFEPLGAVEIQGAREAVVGPDGEFAFVATETGFVTVDVSDSSAPDIRHAEQNLTDDAGNGLRQVFDVKYDDGQLLVASAAQGASPRGFYLYDVTDPTDPSRVGEWYNTPDHGIHNCDLHDGVAYLTGNASDGRKVVAVDVSEPPFETLGTFQPGDWKEEWANPPSTAIHDVYAHGDRVYAAYWDSGTWILDASDPANMSVVARVGDHSIEELRSWSDSRARREYNEPPGNDHYVTVDEEATIMAEGGESWDINNDGTGGPSGITIYDITDETAPERLAHIDAPSSDDNSLGAGSTETTSHNFEIQGGRLYASWYQGGVTIHDVSDPANPERIAWWTDAEARQFWTAQLAVDGEFFVGSSFGNDHETGLLTFPDDAGGRLPNPPDNVEWPTEGSYPTAGEETTTTPPSTTADPNPTPDDPTTDGPTTGPTTGPNEGTTAGGDGTENGDDTTTADGSGGSPGPSVLGTLASVGAGAYLLRKRRRGDDE